jgi:tetratricopeptide (TPR) repeat protein
MDLATALALHQSGQATAAEAAYIALLAAAPENAGALHGYGVLRHQRGDSAGALPLLERAVQADPAAPEHHFNCGLALFRLQRFGEAAAAFAQAARLKPSWPQPHYDLGNALHAAGDWDAAIKAYRAALRLQPDFVPAEVNLGNALKAAGKLDQAISAYKRVLRRRPDLPETHHNLGIALLAQNDAAAAEACFRAALKLRPDFIEALDSLARLLLTAERPVEAIPVAEAAVRAAPSRADLLERLADARLGAGRIDGAIDTYRRACAADPGRNTARFGLAEAFRKKQDFAAAEAELRRLVDDLPTTWLAHHDLGNALRDQGKFAEAEAAYRAALALSETPLALNHLAAVLRDLGRLDEAVAAATRGLALAPDHQDLRYNLAVTHLTAGRHREGFALYDVRFAKYKVPALPGRAWTGQTPSKAGLRGRTLLVHAEQGLGDTIQFVRWLPALAETGARIILRVPGALTRLLAGFPGVTAVIDQAGPLPEYDLHVALMSLPDRLSLPDPCPIPVPYLSADPARATEWRARLAALPGRRIGIAWAGNPGFQADHLRSVPAAALAGLADIPGISLVSLQKGATDLPKLTLADWTGELADFAETAALIAGLDLVISVDTAVAHLAGALGKPVWLLNRFDTCWRWGVSTQDCLWYPTLRQFRQSAPRHWTGVLADVAAALENCSEL